MTPDLRASQGPAKRSRKRPLARRSCLECRVKKARCELPDVYVDSSRTPLPSYKRCHRCNVLGIECVVWDGDRKRQPRLDRRNDSNPRASVEQEAILPAPSDAPSNQKVGGLLAPRQSTFSSRDVHESSRLPMPSTDEADDHSAEAGPSQSANAEHLAASDLKHAQSLLINRQLGWKTMNRTLHTLIERLQRERQYTNYLKLRIDAPPSTPDVVDFLQADRVVQLESHLQDFLVGHPYLPSLSSVHREQAMDPTRPRSLLLAAMTLLGLKGTQDALSSTDIRSLSNYIDRLGTQMLLSSPRDIHLVMAFELLLAHEPGLVGTAASQFELEARGYGLASENLLTCSIRIARELNLEGSREQPDPVTRLTHLSLWCCLRTWEALYAFLGRSVTPHDDLHTQFAAGMRDVLHSVDDEGKKLPSPPRLQDASGPTANSYHEMREFCADLEKRHGRDGILRSAGRTLVCLRIETACYLFESFRDLQATLKNGNMELEEKRASISAIHTTATDGMLGVRDRTHEQLGKS